MSRTRGGAGAQVASTRDLPTIAFFRAGVLLRRGVPVPGILATHRPGAIWAPVSQLQIPVAGSGIGSNESVIN